MDLKREKGGTVSRFKAEKGLKRLSEFNRRQDEFYQLQLTEPFLKMLEKRSVELHLEEEVRGKNGEHGRDVTLR